MRLKFGRLMKGVQEFSAFPLHVVDDVVTVAALMNGAGNEAGLLHRHLIDLLGHALDERVLVLRVNLNVIDLGHKSRVPVDPWHKSSQ